LIQLESEDPKAARLVNLQFFAGITLKEAAASLGIPLRTAEREWAYVAFRFRLQSGLDAPQGFPRFDRQPPPAAYSI
jgi:hypothetical protein